ncbi:hypothetical protein C8Q73DRAFT_833786 [Cubamyces lactineus]|nr:hypothetical protein C8Q73DRAFT_833786 [Cubamyces lactineus]
MNSLAVEVLIRIFSFACTDGGYTACSLSSTSRYIREASHPARFHSVVFTGDWAKLSHFLTLLEKGRAADTQNPTPKVRNLFISDVLLSRRLAALSQDEPAASQAGVVSGDVVATASADEQLVRSGSPSQHISRLREDWARWNDLVSALLHTVAVDLETAVLITDSTTTAFEPEPFVTPFPALREFTLTGSMVDNEDVESSTIPVQYPVLSHIHFLEGTAHESLKHVSKYAPQLTHLKCSGVIEDTVDAIKERATSGAATRDSPDSTPHLFPNLREVHLQFGPPLDDGPSLHNDVLQYRSDVLYPWYMLANHAIPVYILPPDPETDPLKWMERRTIEARRSWMERMEGGGGCWLASEEWLRSSQGNDRPPVYLLTALREDPDQFPTLGSLRDNPDANAIIRLIHGIPAVGL